MEQNQEQTQDRDLVVQSEDGRVVADSRTVAEVFEKEHRNVTRAIDNLEISNEFRLLNFEQGSYIDRNGDEQRCFQMTRDGFSMLVMGFNGSKAARWKEKYIETFNAMEAELLHQARLKNVDFDSPKTILGVVLALKDKSERLEQQLEEQQPLVEGFERIAGAEGSLCITDAAKALQMRPKDLFGFMSQNGWIYKRPGAGHWLGYSSKVQQDTLTHKVTTVLTPDGDERIIEQVRVTPKGLSRLSVLIQPPMRVV